MKRRAYLATLAAASASALTGCTSAQPASGDADTTTASTTTTTTSPTTTITSTATTTQRESRNLVPYDSDASSTFRHRRANPEHTGYVPGSRVPDDPELAWSVELEREPQMAPRVNSQYAIVASRDFEVIDVQGEEILRNDTGASIYSVPIVENRSIPISATGYPGVELQNIETGETRTEIKIDDGRIKYVSSAKNGDLYIICGETLSAYSPRNATYTEQWTVELEKEPTGWITVAGDHVLAPRGNGYVACYRRSDGKKTWEYEVDRYKQISCYNPEANVAHLSGKRYAEIDIETGDVLDTLDTSAYPPVLAGDFKVFYGAGGMINTYDGAKLYTTEFDASAKTPSLADGSIVVPVGETVQAFDAVSGEQLWSFETEDTVAGIALANDHVYVASQDTNFYALGPK